MRKYIDIINNLISLFSDLNLVLSGSIALQLQGLKTRNKITDIDFLVRESNFESYENYILPIWNKYNLWVDFHEGLILNYPTINYPDLSIPIIDYRDIIKAKELKRHLPKQKWDLDFIYKNNPNIIFPASLK